MYDQHMYDQLGGLALTMEGLKARDQLVFDLAKEYQAPVATTFAGGYARDVNDTVTIHATSSRQRPRVCDTISLENDYRLRLR